MGLTYTVFQDACVLSCILDGHGGYTKTGAITDLRGHRGGTSCFNRYTVDEPLGCDWLCALDIKKYKNSPSIRDCAVLICLEERLPQN